LTCGFRTLLDLDGSQSGQQLVQRFSGENADAPQSFLRTVAGGNS
jgi:hypothetical protein